MNQMSVVFRVVAERGLSLLLSPALTLWTTQLSHENRKRHFLLG